jgi:hypothetical protein
MELHNLVRNTIANHPKDTSQKIARIVAELTTPDDLERFYITALEALVADQIRIHRNTTLNSRAGKSAKLDQRRKWWARVVRERVHVGEHRYKPIGDCTVDDLAFCIAERHEQKTKLDEQITKYETIREAMLEHGAVFARELPDGAVSFA